MSVSSLRLNQVQSKGTPDRKYNSTLDRLAVVRVVDY